MTAPLTGLTSTGVQLALELYAHGGDHPVTKVIFRDDAGNAITQMPASAISLERNLTTLRLYNLDVNEDPVLWESELATGEMVQPVYAEFQKANSDAIFVVPLGGTPYRVKYTGSAGTFYLNPTTLTLVNTNLIVLEQALDIPMPGGADTLVAGERLYVRDYSTGTFKVARTSGGTALSLGATDGWVQIRKATMPSLLPEGSTIQFAAQRVFYTLPALSW